MKANDFRVGNLVFFKGEVKELGLWDFSTYIQTNIEHYKPIPLTEEWLERFGFEKDEEYDEGGLVDYRFTLMNGSLEFVSFWNSEEITGVNQPQTRIDVEHVHQLQNLYFALTGKELTIKKIDHK